MSKTPEVVAPVLASDDFPYVNIGHGVPRRSQLLGVLVVLREPFSGDLPGVPAPLPVDVWTEPTCRAVRLSQMHAAPLLVDVDSEPGCRTIDLSYEYDGHDSFQQLAATYPGVGPQVDDGEATDEQWEVFNADLDNFLAQLHARAPIAAVMRLFDVTPPAELSRWHEWSCHELPPFLPFLMQEVFRPRQPPTDDPYEIKDAIWGYLDLACEMWKDWIGQRPVDEQEAAISALSVDIRKVFEEFNQGQAPEVVRPEVVPDVDGFSGSEAEGYDPSRWAEIHRLEAERLEAQLAQLEAEVEAFDEQSLAKARLWIIGEGNQFGPAGLHLLLTTDFEDPADRASSFVSRTSSDPDMWLRLEFLVTMAGDANPIATMAIYRAAMAVRPPAAGDERTAWLHMANNALVTMNIEKLDEEAAELADRVVQYVRENPYITHSAACAYVAVGRHDDAMEQVRLAVELEYDHLDKLRVDTDLGPLRERDDFMALFGNE